TPIAVTIAVTVATATAPVSPVAAVALGRTRIAGSDAGQFLGRLALDLRVVAQPQADATALAVDLDHPHADLVALVQDLLDRVDAAAGRHIGDVEQAVGALGELDERAERGGLDHLAAELVSDLDVLGHGSDPIDQRVALLAA